MVIIRVASDGSFGIFFSAEDHERGLAVLTQITPNDKEEQEYIQDKLDAILAANNLHQYRTLN